MCRSIRNQTPFSSHLIAMNATVHSRLTPSLFSGRTEWNSAFNAAVTIGLSVLLITPGIARREHRIGAKHFYSYTRRLASCDKPQKTTLISGDSPLGEVKGRNRNRPASVLPCQHHLGDAASGSLPAAHNVPRVRAFRKTSSSKVPLE